MINQINRSSVNSNKPLKNQPQFKGALDVLMAPLQLCEQYPMMNVTVLDLTTAIGPRTVIEGQTNVFSGFEAFRRESSGLIVNCLIPSFIVLGIAKLIKNPLMGDKSNMHQCWANEDTINLVAKYWKETKSDAAVIRNNKTVFEKGPQARVYRTLERLLKDTKGIDGKNEVNFAEFDFHDSLVELTKKVFNNEPEPGFFEKRKLKKAAKEAAKAAGKEYVEETPYSKIVGKTHASQNIKIKGYVDKDGKVIDKYFTQGLDAVIGNSTKILKELVDGKDVDVFAKSAKKLLTYKSIGGLAVIIPLAISMQPFNRWWTSKVAGKKGAPIYKDFEESKEKELSPEQKAKLHKQKAISIGSMIAVSLASIMKMPSLAMLKGIGQFSSIFPTMDQARVISTATFASRMGASEDANELKEATMRDIATFCSFYFIGDYVAKGTANLIQAMHNGKVSLINTKEKLKDGANPLEQFWHWMKKTELKATEEVLPEARKWRALCQLSNILFSLVLLGLVIPKVYRHHTDKAREKELKDMGLDPKKYYPTFAMNNHAITNSPAFQKVRTSNN